MLILNFFKIVRIVRTIVTEEPTVMIMHVNPVSPYTVCRHRLMLDSIIIDNFSVQYSDFNLALDSISVHYEINFRNRKNAKID